MLIQSSLPSSIQSPLSFVSDHGKQQNSGPPSDWTHCDETWHGSSENDKCPWDGCRKSILTRDVKDDAAITCSIDHSRTHSNSSAIEDMSASSPKRNDYVYKRRRKTENSFAPLSSEAATDNMKGEIQEVRADVPPVELCKGDLLENGNTPSCQNHHPSTRIDNFGSVEIISKSDSIDDSCCSSKSNVEHGLAFVKIEEDEAAECSSSDIVVTELLRKNPLEKDLSISADACAFVDILGIDASCSQPCKICGILDKPLKMLICDLCEEAFHLSCCNPRVKKIPVDEWYCQSCIRKRPKPLFETTTGGISSNIMGEMSEYRKKFLRSGGGIISFMLKDTEPYTTGVRIGKAFQADVPDWSGRISEAPLFEVQTDDWDCSCAVLWDPIHSDCAVPQELGTEEVLMHLKYIEVLRPRLAAKAQKQTHIKTNGSE
ncbi:uncharacterized protein LOC131217276 isoform X2 [Magnolia sinica]|uniref:uncharacterized protein LOC131217276 isoform X2 n=1 Tax=Magnolia sinica TaxID=86752 RepID=UPI0026584CA7|nr:uncharacterized protein LOC131217276 isoform X2 [Magnolia sinica]XP_058068157.1 uncharacterized protein LOC131217276 isoform X2 [Magnolia sinica]XP_058068158.1 uncharacterized protein LOC131217276 isoform X2 [Magnolia sinica]XP_058068159.1 uncharacterized protein LOC131217276 isoform X2 [Magnolia sinica]